ncbi:MAG: dihydropteroate synthase [Pseudomonadota bacterium]
MLDLSNPQVMGILNVTPDSFADGGRYVEPQQAVTQARRMAAEGATLIDIGGESTRPGALTVTVEQELARVIPVIKALQAADLNATLSIDTCKPEVMRAAVNAGVGLINDVCALRMPGAVEAAAELAVPVCLMHMQGEPRTMQVAPHYADVVAEVRDFLLARVEACIAAGIAKHNVILDPGFGFGKTVAHNLTLLKHLSELCALGFPVLVGLSRKSMLGALLNAPVEDRLYGTVALTTMAVAAGARIVRVHDVRANWDALRVAVAVREG